MTTALRSLGVAALAAMLLAGCGGESVTPPPNPPANPPQGPDNRSVDVKLTLSHESAARGDEVTVTIVVTPWNVPLLSVDLRATGALELQERISLSGTNPVTVTRRVRIPDTGPAGEVTFTAAAEATPARGTATARLVVHERTPPQIVLLEVSPGDLIPGDSIRVAYTITSPRGIREVSATVSDGSTQSTAKTVYQGEKSVTGELRMRTPATVFFGGTVSVLAHDTVGQSAGKLVHLSYHAPPNVGGTVALPNPDPVANPTLLVGDTVQIKVLASASTPLRWIGYSVGDPVIRSDSAAVSGNSAEHVFRVVADGRWQTEGKATLPVVLFARDQRGARRESRRDARVVLGVRRPTRTAELPGAVADAMIDVRRNRAYLSIPSANQVAVLDLASMTFAAPIAVPSPAGIDLTPGGDSLVVGLRNAGALAVVNLATRARTDVRLETTPSTLEVGPGILRVASNGKVLVLITFAGSGVGGELLEYDLRTGRQQARAEAGSGGKLSSDARIARSGNGARVLVRDGAAGGGMGAAIYDAATDAFTATRIPPSTDLGAADSPASISADREGRSFLMGVALYPSDLSSARLLPGTGYYSWGYGSPPTVLAPAGTEVFVGAEPGFWRMRAGDGAVLERVWVNAWPSPGSLVRLVPHPDGRILAVGEHHAFLVDLR
ncbi:MAG TPA: hypothetical protein VF615_12720 [Longimicrobiaceae bacterium]|jgi:hypothetical protein